MQHSYLNVKPTIEGFDTETYLGYIKLITSSNAYLEPTEAMQVLDFLWKHGKKLNFFYNLKYDVSSIIKGFLVSDIYHDMKGIADETLFTKTITLGVYELTLIGFKAMKLVKICDDNGNELPIRSRLRNSRLFYDIAPFYASSSGQRRTLDTVMKEVLGRGKSDKELGIDREKIGNEEGYYEANRSKIIQYGMDDARGTRDLAVKKSDNIHEMTGMYLQQYYSPASIAKLFMDKKHSDQRRCYWNMLSALEKEQDESKSALFYQYTYLSYYGGLVNTPILGKNDNISEIDINSAFPHALTQLKDVKDAIPFKSSAYIKSADYGFLKVQVKYNGLIPYRTLNRTIIYPKSEEKLTTFMTKLEYDYWKERKPQDIHFIDGWFVNSPTGKYPFADYQKMYADRNRYKSLSKKSGDFNDMNQFALKTIMNSTYGVLAQNRNRFHVFTNFVYASYITAMTRIKLYKMIERIGIDNVVSIATDAIFFKDTGQDLGDSIGSELGQWKVELRNKTVILYMSGLGIADGKIKQRGHRNIIPETFLSAKGNTIKILIIAPLAWTVAVRQNKIIDINTWIDMSNEINLYSNLDKHTYDYTKLSFEYLNENSLTGGLVDCDLPSEIPLLDIDRVFKYANHKGNTTVYQNATDDDYSSDEEVDEGEIDED